MDWLEEDEFDIKNNKLSLGDIIPKTGNYLGLDISKNSTGICLITGGIKNTGNITLSDEQLQIRKDQKLRYFEETLLRRYLKGYLLEVIKDMEFDTILIEDAFSGENPKTTRMLYALNTAIDEILLDNLCTSKHFLRISNGSWKRWLFRKLDPEGYYKGMNDKLRIQKCLSLVGVDEGISDGFQDRLDATGMLLGYFLNGQKADDIETNLGIKITWSQLDFAFEIEDFFIFDNKDWLREIPIVYIDIDRVTKKNILEIVNRDPSKLYITKGLVTLGFIADSMNVVDEGEGVLAFWVKKRLRKKLFGQVI